MKKILIAEDEENIRVLLRDFLEDAGYQVIEAVDGMEAIDLFMEKNDFDLVITDIMMPNYNGYELCKEIRKSSKVPIIMLTAKNTENDELFGFGEGADEYIKKPFSPSVLVARVNAIIKRTYGDEEVISKGDLIIDTIKHIVLVNNKEVNLSLTEYKLLMYLINNEGSVISRDLLLNNVWGFDYEGTYRTVDTHITRLRNKLNLKCIKTIRGLGYKFEVQR